MSTLVRNGMVALLMCTAATLAVASGTDFERVMPNDFGTLLLKARKAYEGKRYDEAFETFSRTACAGDKESQSVIGRMYLLGQGVERNDLVGYAWLKVAAEVRMRGYQEVVKKLAAAMTPVQRESAERKATELIELYGLRATHMSCNQGSSRGGLIKDSIVCTPRSDGVQVLLRRCVAETQGAAK